MRFDSLLLTGLSAVSTVFAAPYIVARADNSTKTTASNPLGLSPTDLEVLAFALNLENLEAAFYTAGLNLFDDADFAVAGFSNGTRDSFEQILDQELAHIALLQSVLGDLAPEPCDYSFPLSQVSDMVAISSALELTGEAAYIGSLQIIEDTEILTTAASIEGVEARHSSFVFVLNGLTPFNGPFDTPLNQTQVISLAAGFIVSCPSTNFPLDVVPLPTLALTPSCDSCDVTVGSAITVVIGDFDFSPADFPIVDADPTSAPATSSLAGAFLAYFDGVDGVSFSPIDHDNTTIVPDGVFGTVFVQVVSTDQSFPTFDDTISGVAILTIVASTDSSN